MPRTSANAATNNAGGHSYSRALRWGGRRLLFFTVLLATACGGNVFNDPNAKKDPVEEAVAEMEMGHADAAIVILERLEASLEPGSDDFAKVRSILASAYLLKHHVDLVNLVLALSAAKEERALRPLLALFNFLPEPTDDHITGIEHAIDLLLSIDLERRNTVDDVKLAIALLSDLGLRLKALDTNHDGEISQAEAEALPRAEADAIGKRLGDVTYGVVSHYTASLPSEDSAKAIVEERLTTLASDVAAEPGSSDGERVQNYIKDKAGDAAPPEVTSSIPGAPGKESLPTGAPALPAKALKGAADPASP